MPRAVGVSSLVRFLRKPSSQLDQINGVRITCKCMQLQVSAVLYATDLICLTWNATICPYEMDTGLCADISGPVGAAVESWRLHQHNVAGLSSIKSIGLTCSSGTADTANIGTHIGKAQVLMPSRMQEGKLYTMCHNNVQELRMCMM